MAAVYVYLEHQGFCRLKHRKNGATLIIHLLALWQWIQEVINLFLSLIIHFSLLGSFLQRLWNHSRRQNMCAVSGLKLPNMIWLTGVLCLKILLICKQAFVSFASLLVLYNCIGNKLISKETWMHKDSSQHHSTLLH